VIRVKICGITVPEDALACADAGADAIGLNFVPTSRRCITRDEAREVLRAVRGRGIETVAVVADLDADTLRELANEVDFLQLHGNEPPAALLQLLPRAYKAVRVDGPADVALANTYAGDRILVDAKVPHALGGTGVSFDWSLVTELAKNRKLLLAGGLSPENVERAVRAVRPWCVDVASGVDLAGDPRRKDAARVRSFIARARAA
jgi:phosphoribosylanthranilate isomerase